MTKERIVSLPAGQPKKELEINTSLRKGIINKITKP
jgi:hypothetical protein